MGKRKSTVWKSRIADLRAKGMTLAQLAERLDVPRTTLSDVANGHTEAPVGDLAVKLWQLHNEQCGSAKLS